MFVLPCLRCILEADFTNTNSSTNTHTDTVCLCLREKMVYNNNNNNNKAKLNVIISTSKICNVIIIILYIKKALGIYLNPVYRKYTSFIVLAISTERFHGHMTPSPPPARLADAVPPTGLQGASSIVVAESWAAL